MRNRRVSFVGPMVAVLLVAATTLSSGGAVEAVGGRRDFLPGTPGIGDPYFPLDGNGGYDVAHYDIRLTYDPPTDTITSEVRIKARSTQNLSSFNLDFEGLNVRSVSVDGRQAVWTRDAGELTVVPSQGIRDGRRFLTVIRYDGVPTTLGDEFGPSGFIHTDDGALVAGQPDSAATWYPVNDHPSDRATYTFEITVPEGLEAIANGVLKSQRTRHGKTTFQWDLREPMAPYLTMMAIGEFDVDAYRLDGRRYWDAIDPELKAREAPVSGDRFIISQIGDLTYKRLVRALSVPAGGATLSFWADYDIEATWDFFFVEARDVTGEEWTTLPDVNGHTSQDTGLVCPYWLQLHPFLEHYQSPLDDETCAPQGTTGEWWAATGDSHGFVEWSIDLAAYAGHDIEISIAHVSDDVVQHRGVMIDDIVVSTGDGTTSFEDDADPLDGWTVPGPPAGSEANVTDWSVGTSADVPPPVGEIAAASFGRLPEMLDFMSDTFGRYPFSTAGGVLDEVPALSFALETQTRPVYGQDFFYNAFDGDSVVLHENAHQWFGDSLTIERWQDIWLNEGFATYAEWLWSEHDGGLTAQEWFENRYGFFDETSNFWQIPIGDPGPEDLFSIAVYWRGAMTLHALRAEVGDATFFRILRTWVRQQTGDTVRTDEFIALAERLAGRQLDQFFDTWLMAPGRPVQDQSATSLRVADVDASTFGRARTGGRQHQPA